MGQKNVYYPSITSNPFKHELPKNGYILSFTSLYINSFYKNKIIHKTVKN